MSKPLNETQIAKIVETVDRVLGKRADQAVSLHEPEFKGQEWTYLKNCLDSGFVSSVGEYVNRFEKDLAKFTGSEHAIAVVNGTAALQLCLEIAGVQPGDEVLTPALSFVASANAISHCGAIPHFIDSEKTSLGVDPEKLRSYLKETLTKKGAETINKRTGRIVRAVTPMHTFGHPVNITGLEKVCQEFNLPMIEDAAESLGSYYNGRHTGNFGRLSALSFNGNKTITTGGGGAILTNDADLAQRAKHLSTTAKVPHAWAFEHDEVAYNFRMPNINAALGCAQLEQLTDLLSRKRQLANKYETAFKDVDGVEFFKEPSYAKSNYWLNTILLDSVDLNTRNKVLQAFHDRKILARPAWGLMHRLPMYASAPRMDLSVAEALELRIINIPSSAHWGTNA